MAKKVAGNFYKNGFDSSLGSIKGTNLFSIGDSIDGFSIQGNLEEREVRDIESQLNGFSQPVSLESLNIEKGQVERILENNVNVFLNIDKTKITNYAYFGSLKEFIRVSVEKILTTFPASLYITNELHEDVKLTVMNYSYDVDSNVSTLKVPVRSVDNKYNLYFTEKTFLFSTSNDLKDISSNYQKYTIWNFEEEFPILEFTGSTNPTSGYIHLKVEGNPFPSVSGGSGNIKYHIKPSHFVYEDFINGLETFEAYLLNRESAPKYSASFKEPIEGEDGNIILVDRVYTWKTTDGYNLDFNTYEYEEYLQSLVNLGQKYDDYKTNLISRFLTTTALKEFDTPDAKMDKLLKVYGREFDEIKQYIDGLANVAKASYDKKDNMPDILVKNFAKTLGWGTFTTVTETGLMESFLGNNEAPVFSGESKNLTPVETDIELWRRLIINSAHLFKSKGTRNAIDFLFSIIGAPKSLIDFNEYVYLVDNKLDVNQYVNNEDLNYAFDSEGYPKIQPNSPDYYFQMKGGWRGQVEIAPNNEKNLLSTIGVHKGEYDNGKQYFDIFRQFGDKKGFSLTKTVDNVKSWVHTDSTSIRINGERSTNYKVQDSKLVLNTKELSIYLDPAKAIENDVYEFNRSTDYVINTIELPHPYPNTSLTQQEVSDISFIEYVDLVYSNFINAKNRKVATDGQGGGYPTLRKLYEDYYGSESLKLDLNKVGKFIDMMNGFWLSLLEQFVPSTSIWEGGKKYRNTVFDRQKFVYKHGENDGSEFKTEIPEQPQVTIFTTQVKGFVSKAIEGSIQNFIKAESKFTSSMSFPENPGDGSGEETDNQNNGALRVKAFLTANTMTFRQPDYYMEYVDKIGTGRTTPVVHNISNSKKDLKILFTGNTELLGQEANSGTQFRYKIHAYDYNLTQFDEVVYEKITTTEFNSQSGVTKILDHDLPTEFADGDYLIKGSFVFTATTSQEFGYNFTPNLIKIDTDVLNEPGYYQYGLYDNVYDYWFTIISNPYEPNILTTGLAPNTGTTVNLGDARLMNTVLPLNIEGQTQWLINDKPLGKIWVNVNGNTISESIDANFSDDAEYFVSYLPEGLVLTLANPLSIVNGDTLNVIYLKGADTLDAGSINSETQLIDTITSGTTGIPGNKAYYNLDFGKFEYYFSFKLDSTKMDSLVVILNGNKLLNGTDYYASVSDPYKIIFAGDLDEGDVLVFYYPSHWTSEDLFLTKSKFIAVWEAFNASSEGVYTVQITYDTDPTFQNIVYTGATTFQRTEALDIKHYELEVANITIPNRVFLYRIKAEKFFYNMLGEKLTTTTYSKIIRFSTDNRVSSY